MKIATEYRPADFVGTGMNAHSIYFLALGELGFPGAILLLTIIGWNLRANQTLARELKARAAPTLDQDLQLLSSLSAALIAFASAGAFLSALYYPHLYILAGLLTAGRHVVRARMADGPSAAAAAPTAPKHSLHWALQPKPKPALARPAVTPQHLPGAAVGVRRGRLLP